MKIYTKTGDNGTTGLFGGARVAKDDARIEAYGSIDELNASIGLIIALDQSRHNLQTLLEPIQHTLFIIGSHLATHYALSAIPDTLPQFPETAITQLEQTIDTLEETLPPLKQFILPGGSAIGAHIHMARTVCRRAERACIHLTHTAPVLPEILQYMNRLSDFLFVLSRVVNHQSGTAEIPWKK